MNVEFYEGKPISVELPPTVDMTVVETEPGLKGATVSNVTKPAKMETGLVVQVPAVHQRRRKDPRQHRGRHVSGKSLNAPPQRRSSSSGQHRPQIQHQPVVLDSRDDRRISQSQPLLRLAPRCPLDARSATWAVTARESSRRRSPIRPASSPPSFSGRPRTSRSARSRICSAVRRDHRQRRNLVPTVRTAVAAA